MGGCGWVVAVVRSNELRITLPKTSVLSHYYSDIAALDHLRIVQHPQSRVVPPAAPVTLTCRATLSSGSDPRGREVGQEEEEEEEGEGELTYVWYMNGLSMLEDTRADYHIPSMTEEDEGMYSCEVSTLNQSIMSEMASLSLAKE